MTNAPKASRPQARPEALGLEEDMDCSGNCLMILDWTDQECNLSCPPGRLDFRIKKTFQNRGNWFDAL
jgi:hypothetical protein